MASTETPQGRPWTVVGTFSTFEAAASRADIERGTRGQQVKVKQITAGYTVRVRQDQSTAVKPQPVSETSASPGPQKRSKLKAKDRRALERQNDSEV